MIVRRPTVFSGKIRGTREFGKIRSRAPASQLALSRNLFRVMVRIGAHCEDRDVKRILRGQGVPKRPRY